MAMVLTHEEYLALSGDAKRYREQRDRLREALEGAVEALYRSGLDYSASEAQAALKATEDTP